MLVGTSTDKPVSAYAIPVDDPSKPFKPFQITVQKVHYDEFNMWTMGELQALDDFSSLFNGTRKQFPLTVAGEAFAIQARTGSNIVVVPLQLVSPLFRLIC